LKITEEESEAMKKAAIYHEEVYIIKPVPGTHPSEFMRKEGIMAALRNRVSRLDEVADVKKLSENIYRVAVWRHHGVEEEVGS
jgi:hypothetical protein